MRSIQRLLRLNRYDSDWSHIETCIFRRKKKTLSRDPLKMTSPHGYGQKTHSHLQNEEVVSWLSHLIRTPPNLVVEQSQWDIRRSQKHVSKSRHRAIRSQSDSIRMGLHRLVLHTRSNILRHDIRSRSASGRRLGDFRART